MGKKDKKDKHRSAPVLRNPWPLKAGLFSLVIIQLVCPLLFFTNLTRNPYYTQIALLNIAICFCVVMWGIHVIRSGAWRLPRHSFEWPLIGFLGVAFLSTLLSWIDHEFVRVGIQNEGIRLWVFTVVNCVFALYLPFFFSQPIKENDKPISIWSDIIFALFWGFAWFGFHTMKDPNPKNLIWDTYGGFLWGVALIYGWIRMKEGRALHIFHVIFTVSLLAGLYGIMQYMGRDIIWGSPIQPYGGRPVSTFGNPNFMSSYLMMSSVIAVALSLQAKGNNKWGYGFVGLVCIVATLCTLTRSTYVGLFATFLALGIFLFRRDHLQYLKGIGIVVGVLVLLILLFPATPVRAIQSPLARFVEIFDAIQSGDPYGPWHQRVLIWSSAWDMVQERFWFGKGWGLFELFYPFYQGGHTMTDLFRYFRTHANNAHNVLMEVWSQTGFLGVGMSLWLLATMVWGGLKIYRSKLEGVSRFVAAALVAGIIGMMVDNFFGNVSVFFAVPAFLFWWNVGALYNEADQIKFREISVSKYPMASAAGLILLFALSTCGSIYFYQRWKQEVHYFDGFKLAKMGQVEASMKALEKAYAWFPGEVNTNYELGNSYSRYAQLLGNKKLIKEGVKYKDKAIDAYQAALDANPGYDEIYFNMGVSFIQRKKFDKAEQFLKLAIYINPLLRDAYGSLSNLYAKQNRLKEAGETLAKAVQVYPEDKDLIVNLGYFYTKSDQHEKAFEIYKKAYQLDPNFSVAWNNMRLAAQKIGRKEPLLDYPVLIERMDKAVARRDFASAKKAAQRMVELLPNYPDAYLSLGNTLFYTNEREAAIEAIKKAIELKPNFVTAYVNLGEVYRSLEQFETAREQYQAALAIDPNNKQAIELLKKLP